MFLVSLINTSIVNKLKNNDRTNITIIMIAIVHSIYSKSVHATALHAGLMDNDAERYCNKLKSITYLLATLANLDTKIAITQYQVIVST